MTTDPELREPTGATWYCRECDREVTFMHRHDA
jgi:hypothetical protein